MALLSHLRVGLIFMNPLNSINSFGNDPSLLIALFIFLFANENEQSLLRGIGISEGTNTITPRVNPRAFLINSFRLRRRGDPAPSAGPAGDPRHSDAVNPGSATAIVTLRSLHARSFLGVLQHPISVDEKGIGSPYQMPLYSSTITIY